MSYLAPVSDSIIDVSEIRDLVSSKSTLPALSSENPYIEALAANR